MISSASSYIIPCHCVCPSIHLSVYSSICVHLCNLGVAAGGRVHCATRPSVCPSVRRYSPHPLHGGEAYGPHGRLCAPRHAHSLLWAHEAKRCVVLLYYLLVSCIVFVGFLAHIPLPVADRTTTQICRKIYICIRWCFSTYFIISR